MNIHDKKFALLGNNLAIDFINTQVIQNGELVDMLGVPADINHWAQQVGYTLTSDVTINDLATVKILREGLKTLVLAAIEGTNPSKDELVILNYYLEEHRTHQQLEINPETGELRLAVNNNKAHLSSLLANVAYEGAQLLASSQVSYVKSCSNPECVLLFLDTSRTKRRRWCSMDTCGNRAKVARHYRKETQ
ncbi:CGNR zinc finger domain-containing protein [Shewanella inventionis]|uniref:RNA-binding protein n=1 Tax=Shewanella inventionis TaxID=1738770 RepID=A0ABQ1JJB7_9GAMM|nr:CGNR zinc finger domain-containing protein [Shewanella inventionis]MCL1159198.1 CGNR zinc finger domain-containing protein [Shewanella inventionis]GGB67411.1 RNA-binding protein [Shewanella inventionis]